MRSLLIVALSLTLGCSGSEELRRREAEDRSKPATISKAADPSLITCEGVGRIRFTDDLSSLERKAGEHNLHMDSLFLEGTFESLVTRVWKDTPQEITVYWQEKQSPYNTIRMLEVSHPESVYHFSNGIQIGTTLEKIAELNGAPVQLYGFGWDYGGTFSGFSGGKLASSIPCFGGVFALPEGTQLEDKTIQGDHEIRSDAAGLKEVEAVLVKIRVGKE